LVATVLAPIPAVGALLVIGVIVTGIILYLRTPREDLYAIYQPIPFTGVEELIVDRLEVVGESFYIGHIALVVGAAGRDLRAQLYWEPRNPHDPHGLAVRVDLVGGDIVRPCGHIAADIAPAIQPIVKANANKGLVTVATATVFGGTADKPNYGVILGSGVARAKRKPEFR